MKSDNKDNGLIGMVKMLCVLFWWLPLLGTIGAFFAGQLGWSIVMFFLFMLMFIIWRESEGKESDDKD